MSRSPSLPYKIPGRLSDVMALIQVLSLDRATHRSETGLIDELQGKPGSALTWTKVASGYPEFFRVDAGGTHNVSLVSRHVLPRADGRKPPLEPELMGKLLTVALDLHDREIARAHQWKAYMPIVVAIITGGFTLLGFLIASHV